MTSICMNCENAFISNGPYFTCGKCHGPCDTFRYTNYGVDESYYDATHTRQKDDNFFGNQSNNAEDLPFRRRVPKPEPSTSRSLKKSQASDQFRVFGYRMLNFCSRYADPFTWLEMMRDSKSKYDVKKKGKSQSEERDENPREQDSGSSNQPL
ncbi:uncharacterized protein LOC119077039 [Bradysia coprophila]|uniref:uncharacterized protein LOC119077039 n=1 Tax=Bradysia coprophila TaxID=38358 RepID=UPI00187DA0F5|nr:uncharacterized protein LOC119077039 [Bradysia coprophila]